MKEYTYLLVHMYTPKMGDAQHKMIGLYSSQADAQAAIQRLKDLPGFVDWPDAFIIRRFKLNTIYSDEESLKFSPY